MKAVQQVSGSLIAMDRANVDTDQIIPKQFLKSIKRTGFGDNLFDGWRFLDEGEMGKTPNERVLNPEFELNQPMAQGGSILLARTNFGCGSSREHAVWALQEYGIECVIAPSFADIFYNNSFKNGLLLVVLPEDVVDALFDDIAAATAKTEQIMATVDVRECRLTIQTGEVHEFQLDEHRQQRLLNGWDDIGMTLAEADQIRDFEANHRRTMPWLFHETLERGAS